MDFISEHLVARTGLEAWYDARAPLSTNVNAFDRSANARHATCSATNAPVLETISDLNDQVGWYWNGTTSIPLVYTGAVSAKQVFCVFAFEDATFSSHRGVVSGKTTGNLLTSNNSGNKMYEFATDTYRKANRLYANGSSLWAAPVSSNFAVVELVVPSALSLDGVSLGQQLADTARRMKGWICEVMIYSAELPQIHEAKIYQYFAKRYHLWEENSDSTKHYFPFVGDWKSAVTTKKRVLYDEAEDGTPMYRIKRGKQRVLDLEFVSRTPDELYAADAFYDEHYPGTQFIYRDKRIYPADEITVRFAKDAEVPSSSVNHTSFGYQLAMDEVNGSDGGDLYGDGAILTT